MDHGGSAQAPTEGETTMHRHFEDRFDASNLGIRTATRSRLLVDGGGGGKPAPTPTTTIHTRKTSESGRTKSVPVTPTDQVKEAVKDGAISAKEKTAFDKSPTATAEVLSNEQKRLTDAVRKAQGDDLERTDDGRLKIEDGKPVVDAGAVAKPTEHERRVHTLAETRDAEGLDEIDSRIARLEASGATVGVDALRERRSQRAAEEAQVVDVVEDKLALVGTLEAERLTLDAATSADAKDDFQKLRTEAQRHIEQFNANGGQFYEGNDWLGDDWDPTEVDFDRLAERFHDDPEKLAQFAEVQGQDDDHLEGKSAEEVEEYLVSIGDTEESTRISLRHQAAQELQGIFGRYNAARDAVEGQAGRSVAIETEIAYLNDSIETDLSSLSPESLGALEEHITPIDGIIEAPRAGAPASVDKPRPSAPTGGDRPNKQAPTTPSGADRPNKQAPATPSGAPDSTPDARTRTVDIDYSKPEHRQQVLTQAQQQNLLPEQNVAFNDAGEAVYTVQPNDSYWRIADMSDGTAPHEFDSQHFSQLVTTNSERLGRDPQVGLIHPDEQVIIQHRSVDELVQLLSLPTTEELPVEPEADQRVHNQPR